MIRPSATPSRAIDRRGSHGWWALEIAAARSAVTVLTEHLGSIQDGEAALNRAMAGLVAVQRRYRQAIKEGRVRD